MSMRFLATNAAVLGTILAGQVMHVNAANPGISQLISKEVLSAEQIAAHAIRSALKVHDYTLLGTILKANVDGNIPLKSVLHIAKYEHSSTLQHAVNATEAFLALEGKPDIAVGDYLQIALFIEANLHEYAEKKRYFFPTTDTGLVLPLEFDPKTKKTFIILSSLDGTALNYGLDRNYYKALKYSRKEPEVIARGEETGERAHEIHMLERFEKASGVVNMIAHKSHEVGSDKFTAVYLPLYSPGSLRAAFDAGTQLSLYEQASIALNLLLGLHEIHHKKIAHRNLGSRNYLVDIPEGTPGTRTIESAITNLEHALKLSDLDGVKVQVNPSYVAPEGIFHGKLHGHHYFRTDVYALGLVLYQLFYNEQAPWQSPTYVTHKKKSAESRYKKLIHKIRHHTNARRSVLAAKKETGTMTPQENFELLILKMVDADPEKRGTASALYEQMKAIFESIPTT